MESSKGNQNAAPRDEKAVLMKRLEQELLEHNDFFDMVVDMIPSKLYISGKSDGDGFNPKYFKGPSEKEARKVAAKAAKRQKLDPAASKSTSASAAAVGDGRSKNAGTIIPPTKPVNFTPGQSRIEALRAKLHAKIASKQNRPPVGEDDDVAGTVSKRAARRLEKNRRKEESKRRKKQAGTAASKNSNATYTITPTTPSSDPMEDLKHVDYGIISGLNTDSKKNYLEANKALSSKGKNLHKILADAEAKQQKLQALKNSTDARDKEKAAALQWSDTFKEADGVRVKDDPAKLRRAVKRREAKRAKSQKAWKTRMEQQSEKAKNRQQIRQHNLQTRKQGGAAGANLSRRKIADAENPEAKKKVGGGRAGFEGRKQGFLNSPKETAAGGGAGGKAGKKHKQQ